VLQIVRRNDFDRARSAGQSDRRGAFPATNFVTLDAETAREAFRRSRAPIFGRSTKSQASAMSKRAPARRRCGFSVARSRAGPFAADLCLPAWRRLDAGDLSTYEPLCRRLTRVLARRALVDYRLAPEHPFPAALDDTLVACRWLFANAAKLGLDPDADRRDRRQRRRNLAAVAATLNANGELGAKFVAQILIYPCLDLTRRHRSHIDLATGFLCSPSRLYDWYVDNYLAGHDARDPRVSPFLAPDLSGLAPTVVLHAGFDPLRDEAIAYVARLRRAGVPVTEIAFADMIHGFLNMGAFCRRLATPSIASQQRCRRCWPRGRVRRIASKGGRVSRRRRLH